MRDASHHLAERGHLLGLREVLLHAQSADIARGVMSELEPELLRAEIAELREKHNLLVADVEDIILRGNRAKGAGLRLGAAEFKVDAVLTLEPERGEPFLRDGGGFGHTRAGTPATTA